MKIGLVAGKYNNSNKIRHFLKGISNDLNKLNYDEVKSVCNVMLHSIPTPIVDFDNAPWSFNQSGSGGLNLFYRARLEENNIEWENLRDLNYIPEEKRDLIKRFGRVNKPNESMFYGSTNYATACIEAITKGNAFEERKNVILDVSVWKVEAPLKFIQMPYSEKHFEAFYNSVNFESESIKLQHVKKFNSELRSHFEFEIEYEILEFFSDEFAKFNIKEDVEYQLSNYYADRIFNRIKGFEINEEIDGILYPSVASSYQEKNIALIPESVDSKLKFLSAMKVWIADFSKTSGGAQFIPLKQKVKANSDGKLDWNHYTR